MKFSTSTITNENTIVPWLAAEGALAYSPLSPPTSDYFFLYNFILPGIFSKNVNLRQHYWFGDYSGTNSYSIYLLKNFWLEFLHDGDTLMVTRVDRLARSIKDLQDIVYALKEKNVTLKATEQPIDTRTASDKAFLDMLGVFAEFETNLRRERQLEGIAAAKQRGAYSGRKKKIDDKEIQRLHFEEKIRPTEIARSLGIGRTSVYRAISKDNKTT